MNRIEEIKQKLFKCQYVDIGESVPFDDIDYLLSKLEIAVLTLMGIAGEEMPLGAKMIVTPQEAAIEALKQIRE